MADKAYQIISKIEEAAVFDGDEYAERLAKQAKAELKRLGRWMRFRAKKLGRCKESVALLVCAEAFGIPNETPTSPSMD